MTRDKLIEKTDKAIHELVYSKYDLQKAYNYYNGIRDAFMKCGNKIKIIDTIPLYLVQKPS